MGNCCARNLTFGIACMVGMATVHADEQLPPQAWGNISGRLVFDGDSAEPAKLEITRDEEFCGPFELFDESLVVDPGSKGIRNVAVWIDSRDDVPVHPDVAQLSEKPAVLDNRDCRFQPRMLTLRTDQELHIGNSDPISHNAAVYARRNQPFSIVIAQNEPLVRSFRRAESLPIRVECSIHAWMRAHVLICEHPYSVVSDEQGRFELRNVPAGDWTLHLWHERPGNLRTLSINGQSQKLERGLLKVTVPVDAEANLGDILVESTQFSEDQS